MNFYKLFALCDIVLRFLSDCYGTSLLLQEFSHQTMIYDVNSPLFRSFLSQKGGAAAEKRKTEEQKPREQKPKANENKPVMNE
eukprot:Gb_35687 [translate_table: standard]